MEKDKNLEEVIKNTSKIISVNEIIDLLPDDEDWEIYERRCYESDKRMSSDRY